MQNQFTFHFDFRRACRALAICAVLALPSCEQSGDPSAQQPENRAAEPHSGQPAAAPIEASRAAPLPQVELTAPRNILLITVDTLRPDHLSLYGYSRATSPSLDRYFANATRYASAYSTEANTSPSVVSILTGLYPARHRVRLFYQRIPSEVHTLPDYLAAAGFQTAAVVSNVVLTGEAIGLSTRFDHYDDFVDEREENLDVYERRASRTSDAAIQWLTEERDAASPHFLWAHYIDPHGPYQRPEEATTATFQASESQPIELDRVIAYQRVPGVDDGRAYIDRYDEEIAYADAEIGRLLEAYESLGLLESSIIIFTADHGENMIEHEVYFNHGHQVWNSIMRVPLVIRTPGAEAREIDIPVTLADLTPTVLEMLDYPGLKQTKAFDGIPLQNRTGEDSISLEASGYSAQGETWAYRHHRALVSGSEKWFTSVDRAGKVVDRGLYNLDQDPGETTALPWHFGGKGNTLLRWFEADPDPAGVPAMALKGQRLDAPKVAPGRTEDQIRALRALGYVE